MTRASRTAWVATLLMVAAGAATAVGSHLAVPVDPHVLTLSLLPGIQTAGFGEPLPLGRLLAFCVTVWALLHLLLHLRCADTFSGRRARIALAALAALCLVSFPFASSDSFLYPAHGATWLEHGADPYEVAPDEVPGHSLARCGPWCDQPAQYGPLAVWLGAGLFAVAGGGWGLLLASRLLALACMAAAFLLADRIGRRNAERNGADARGGASWLIVAASPLVLVEAGVAAHNDAWVALLLLAVVHFLLRDRPEFALPLFAAAATVKYTSLVLLPAVLVYLWRRRSRSAELRRRLLPGLAIAAGLVVALVAPFGASILSGIESASRQAHRSPAWALGLLLDATGADPTLGIHAGRALAMVLALALATRVRDASDLSWVLCATYLALLLVGTAWFQPWYLLPLLPLAVASGRRWLADAAVVFAASALVGLYGIFFLTYSWTTGVVLWMTAVSFLPVLVLLGLLGLAARRRAGVP